MEPSTLDQEISPSLWQQICEKRLEVMLVSLLVYTTGLFDTVSSQIGGVC